MAASDACLLRPAPLQLHLCPLNATLFSPHIPTLPRPVSFRIFCAAAFPVPAHLKRSGMKTLNVVHLVESFPDDAPQASRNRAALSLQRSWMPSMTASPSANGRLPSRFFGC